MDSQTQLLLVEDDPFDERLAIRAFSKSEVVADVAVVRDGQEAIEYLANQSNVMPSLILLDLKLPKRHGHEVLKWIRENARTRLVPVVCFSSSAERTDVEGCYGGGANSFVRKAVDYDEYIARFKKLVEYWLLINEPCGGKPA